MNRFGDVLSANDARGKVTRYEYDAMHRVTRIIYPDGGEVTRGYDEVGNLVSRKDARGFETVTAYDLLGRPTRVTTPDGQSITMTYDTAGNLVSRTDKAGNATTFQYDSRNRRTVTEKAGIVLETLSYNALGQVSRRTDANGNVTTYEYDRRGLLISSTEPEGASTRLDLDAMGDPERSTDAEGRDTARGYDLRRRVVWERDASGATTNYRYDGNDNRVSEQQPLGGTTTFVYGNRNWMEAVRAPEGRETTYERDRNGNLLAVKDPQGRTFAFTYDEMNRRETASTSGGTQRYGYDKNGNMVSHVDARGRSTSFVYDNVNRETSRTLSAGSDGLTGIATTYDANGNPLTVTESYTSGPARTTTFRYDAFDRPISETDGFGGVMSFSYDKNGNRLTLSTQDGRQTRYGYDGLNRLTGLAGPGGTMQYGYDRSGLRLNEIGSNGTTTTIGYDQVGRRTRQQISRGNVPLNVSEYAYDRNGNRIQERINRPHSPQGAQVTDYAYDGADRLVRTTLSRGPDVAVTDWTYDKSDNRLTEQVERRGADAGTVQRTYGYDEHGLLRSITDSSGASTTLEYDEQGNLVRKLKGSDTTVFEWSSRNLLTSVSRNGSLLGRYDSNYAGLRVRKEAIDPIQPNAPPRVVYTQWDDENAVQDREAGGAVVTRYDFAYHQAVMLWSATDVSQLLHEDAMGSVVVTTGPDGQIVSEQLYDAWGVPIVRQGMSVNKFAYTGHQADPETGLYYFKARYYDPELGRFISEDPADGEDGRPASYQRYLYAYANPLMYWDPDGQVAQLVELAEGLSSVNKWLRASAATCTDGGFVCNVGSAAIGVTRAFVSAGEAAVRTVNVVANVETVLLGQLGVIPDHWVDESKKELEGTKNAVKQTYQVLSTEEGRTRLTESAFETIRKAANGDGGAISDLTEFGAGVLLPAPGAAAGKVADKIGDVVGNFTRSVERGTVREALEGTQTAGKVIGEIAESSVPKQTGRLLSEGTSGPASGTSASKTVRSVEAEVIPPKMVDRPMFAAGGANSVTRRQYIMANLAESRAGNDVSKFLKHVENEASLTAARSMAAKGIKVDVDAMARAAAAPDRGGLTRAGRALDKHGVGQRNSTSPFPAPRGGPAEKNAMGQFQVEDLLTHPQATFKQLGRGGIEVRVPDGRAMRYDADGRFAGFID